MGINKFVFNRIFRKKFSHNAIIEGIENASNFAASTEPIKTFSNNYFAKNFFLKFFKKNTKF